MAKEQSAGALVGLIAAFVLVGFPLVYVIWEAVNHALAFDFGAIRWVVVLPALVLFIVLLMILSRVVRRLSGPADAS